MGFPDIHKIVIVTCLIPLIFCYSLEHQSAYKIPSDFYNFWSALFQKNPLNTNQIAPKGFEPTRPFLLPKHAQKMQPSQSNYPVTVPNLGENKLYDDPASAGFIKVQAQKYKPQPNLVKSKSDLFEMELENSINKPVYSKKQLAESEIANTKLSRSSKYLLSQKSKKMKIHQYGLAKKTKQSKSGKIKLLHKHLLNYQNAQYVIKVRVGSRKKKFKFILDTGSTTILLITNKCKTHGCQEHRSYIPNKKAKEMAIKSVVESSDLTTLSDVTTHKISYAQGYVKYRTMIDDFYIGALKITKQSFGGVVSEKSVFENADYDGLIGQAYKQLGVPPGITPIFDNVIKQKKLKDNVFGLYIARDGHKSSRFWLGGVNMDYILDGKESNIVYHDVIKKSWWTLKLDAVLIDGEDTGLCKTGNCKFFNFLNKKFMISIKTVQS